MMYSIYNNHKHVGLYRAGLSSVTACYVIYCMLCDLLHVMWFIACYVIYCMLCDLLHVMWFFACYVMYCMLCDLLHVMWFIACYVIYCMLCDSLHVLWFIACYVIYSLSNVAITKAFASYSVPIFSYPNKYPIVRPVSSLRLIVTWPGRIDALTVYALNTDIT